jgi:hypothetical protein
MEFNLQHVNFFLFFSVSNLFLVVANHMEVNIHVFLSYYV